MSDKAGSLPFGTRVQVKATAVPVYGTVGDLMRPSQKVGSSWTLQEPTGEVGLKALTSGGQPFSDPTEGWPGDPVPDWGGAWGPKSAGLEPTTVKGDHRRIRRIPLPEPTEGVVVGHTVRHEGRYHAGGASRSYYSDASDYDPPYLAQHRRVAVVQVALDMGGPASVVDVWADDLAPSLVAHKASQEAHDG